VPGFPSVGLAAVTACDSFGLLLPPLACAKYNMHNLRHFARVYRNAAPMGADDMRMPFASSASGTNTHRESVAPMQAFGKMLSPGKSLPA
jgi:hypothetical protein